LNWEAVSALAEVFGVVLVVVTLLYLAVEVRQNTQQSRREAQRDLVQELGQLSLAVATNGELARILQEGASGLKDLQPVERMQFQSYMHHLFELFEQQHLLFQEGAGDPETWIAMKSMMNDFLTTTGGQDWWELRARYFRLGFQQYVNAQISELQGKATN
jgi:hypothetical protein